MTDTTGAANAPEPESTAQLQKPGEFIRDKREAIGMTQVQVGEALHLTVHYIKSLENDEYGKLPGLTFVKGYFRAYARLLKLDEAELLDCYDSYIRSLGLQESTQEQTLRVRRRNDQAILWAVVAGVILTIGLGSGWWFVGRREALTPAPVVATLPRSSNVPGAATPAERPVQPEPVQAGQPAQPQGVPPSLQETTAADYVAQIADPANDVTSGTLLMTEDGPVVLTDDVAPESAAIGTVANNGAQSDPVLAPALDAPGAAPLVPDTAGMIESATPATDMAAAARTNSPGGNNTRRVELVGVGADQLELQFTGNSWIEVDDAARVRLFSDMMRNGDALSIKAAAPFHILLGDATGVTVLLNGQPLPLASTIRSDKTARIVISAEGISAQGVE
jgi:cytoskeleton protein RodZ